MAKTIDITSKFSSDKPTIKIGKKTYEVNNGVKAVMSFQSAGESGVTGMLEAIKITLGAEAYEEIGVEDMSLDNIRVLTTGIMAAMQGLTYDEAAARFRQSEQDQQLV